MRRFFYSCILVFLPLLLCGQTGYIATDTSYYSGFTMIKVKPSEASRKCVVGSGAGIRTYTPEEITEYGIIGDKVYVSREVSINGTSERLFLERLVKDSASLYRVNEQNKIYYFIGRDSAVLIPLSRKSGDSTTKNYREVVRDFTSDKPVISKEIGYVAFNRGALSRFFRMYNEGVLLPFPARRFGVLASYGIIDIHNPANGGIIADAGRIDFKPDKTFLAGFFYETPLGGSDFSFRPEMQVTGNAFAWNDMEIVNEKVSYDIVVNTSTLRVPFLLRYTYVKGRLRPFVNAGPDFSYAFRNESTAYLFKAQGDVIETTDMIKTPFVAKVQYGFEGGAGLQFDLGRHRGIDLECRYVKQWGESTSWDSSCFQIITSYNLF
ncbi:MAG: outer membrane beta-barrel protein [Bacteroidales bacterium]